MGVTTDFFTDGEAVNDVFRVLMGIPRIINRICEKSSTYATTHPQQLIDDYMIRYSNENEMMTYNE